MKKTIYTLALLCLAASAALAARIKTVTVERTDGSKAIETEVNDLKEVVVVDNAASRSLKFINADGTLAEEMAVKDVKEISFSSYIDPSFVGAPPAKYGKYLDQYEPLKNYIDRTSGKVNPNFKLGIAIENFQVNNTNIFNMVAESFDEFTLGNEMKFASVVRGDGSMDFGTVKSIVAKAKEKGLTIYGHTLGWHSQQNIQYLTSVMAAKEDPTPETVNEDVTCFQVRTTDKKSDPWDSQVWFAFEGNAFNSGDKWEVSMKIKAARQATVGTQIHKEPGSYLHYNAIGNVEFTPEWATFKASGTIDSQAAGGFSIAFNLNDYANANTYFFDDVSFKLNGKELVTNGSCDAATNNNFYVKELGYNNTIEKTEMLSKISYERINTIPLSEDERGEALAGAMDKWIKGMMEATDGYVTTWDVVNEAIGGGAINSRGFYELQHADNWDNNGVSGDNFYWQDVMGDIAYVRTAVASARKHFKGDPEKLLLFVNDYNLESWWDQNLKAKSMVDWIKQWEADGVTKIDGIGTQMHISFMNNENDMAIQKNAIVEMFKILAASGKLIKITELDMGYVPQMWGTSKKSKELTPAQHKQMADFYQFIVEKYFEIIPVEQQYGITWWCLGDSPEGSGWRAGEPVGLLDQNNNRKEAYAGVADGLYNATKK